MRNKRTIYSVSGGGKLECFGNRMWFNRGLNNDRVWSNFVWCKTHPHALRQFNRVPGRYAQIDARGGGKPPSVIKYRDR